MRLYEGLTPPRTSTALPIRSAADRRKPLDLMISNDKMYFWRLEKGLSRVQGLCAGPAEPSAINTRKRNKLGDKMILIPNQYGFLIWGFHILRVCFGFWFDETEEEAAIAQRVRSLGELGVPSTTTQPADPQDSR